MMVQTPQLEPSRWSLGYCIHSRRHPASETYKIILVLPSFPGSKSISTR